MPPREAIERAPRIALGWDELTRIAAQAVLNLGDSSTPRSALAFMPRCVDDPQAVRTSGGVGLRGARSTAVQVAHAPRALKASPPNAPATETLGCEGQGDPGADDIARVRRSEGEGVSFTLGPFLDLGLLPKIQHVEALRSLFAQPRASMRA
jgi:hypothetical protein